MCAMTSGSTTVIMGVNVVGKPRHYVKERTWALVSSKGESVHAPAGLYEIKGEVSSTESDEKKISLFLNDHMGEPSDQKH